MLRNAGNDAAKCLMRCREIKLSSWFCSGFINGFVNIVGLDSTSKGHYNDQVLFQRPCVISEMIGDMRPRLPFGV